MTNFNITNLMANTKQALCSYINEQAEQIAELRARISALTATVEASKGVASGKTVTERAKSLKEEALAHIAARKAYDAEHNTRRASVAEKRHTYASHGEACNNCKRLASSDLNRRYMFSVQGNDVVVRVR